MKIDNLFNTYKVCEETQKIRNRSTLTNKHIANNKSIAVEMLKENKTIALISKTTGISRDAITSYKKQLNRCV